MLAARYVRGFTMTAYESAAAKKSEVKVMTRLLLWRPLTGHLSEGRISLGFLR